MIAPPASVAAPPPDPAAPLFKVRAFRLLFTTRLASNTSNQMLAVVVGWQIYDLTGSALNLGLIGLVQFLPPLLLSLVSGQLADRFDRRFIVRWCYAVELAVVTTLLALTLLPHPPVAPIYGLLFINAMARTFEVPALQSLLPSLMPSEILGRAIAVYASAGKMSTLVGPSVGGLIYVLGPSIDYTACAALITIAATASAFLPKPPPLFKTPPKVTLETVFGGLAFIWNTPIILGALSLDLLVTFFGGVTALLPIFARDVLAIGPWGFGILRSAPALGALVMATYFAHHRVTRRAGLLVFSGVALYGAMTIVFGLSRDTVLSIAALFVLGMGDMTSQVVRQTLVQVGTPDDTRGRVAAVSSLSVNIGSQLGMFESGVTADWLGAVGSVILGGVSVFAIAAVWIWRFPSLREVQRPDELPAR